MLRWFSIVFILHTEVCLSFELLNKAVITAFRGGFKYSQILVVISITYKYYAVKYANIWACNGRKRENARDVHILFSGINLLTWFVVHNETVLVLKIVCSESLSMTTYNEVWIENVFMLNVSEYYWVSGHIWTSSIIIVYWLILHTKSLDISVFWTLMVPQMCLTVRARGCSLFCVDNHTSIVKWHMMKLNDGCPLLMQIMTEVKRKPQYFARTTNIYQGYFFSYGKGPRLWGKRIFRKQKNYSA